MQVPQHQQERCCTRYSRSWSGSQRGSAEEKWYGRRCKGTGGRCWGLAFNLEVVCGIVVLHCHWTPTKRQVFRAQVLYQSLKGIWGKWTYQHPDSVLRSRNGFLVGDNHLWHETTNCWECGGKHNDRLFRLASVPSIGDLQLIAMAKSSSWCLFVDNHSRPELWE